MISLYVSLFIDHIIAQKAWDFISNLFHKIGWFYKQIGMWLNWKSFLPFLRVKSGWGDGSRFSHGTNRQTKAPRVNPDQSSWIGIHCSCSSHLGLLCPSWPPFLEPNSPCIILHPLVGKAASDAWGYLWKPRQEPEGSCIGIQGKWKHSSELGWKEHLESNVHKIIQNNKKKNTLKLGEIRIE